MPRTVHFDGAAPVATITIEGYNEFNAITSAMFGMLARAFAQVDASPEIRAVILRGAGEKNFSAGADLKETEERRAKNDIAQYSAPHALARQRRNYWFPFEGSGLTSRMQMTGASSVTPIIAALTGYCLAAALIVVYYRSSLRIAGESARFGFSEVRFGGGGGVAMSTLGHQVAFAPLQELAIGEYIDARAALTMGMVNEVVPDEEVFPRVEEVAHRIAEAPRLNLLAEKRGLLMARNQSQEVAGVVASSTAAFVRLGIGSGGGS